MASSVKLILSKREISFKPQDARNFKRLADIPASDLTVAVINTTEKFASFQLELFVEGVENSNEIEWYSTEPHICAKKPPGDRTQFQITILKSPIPSYDVKIPLTIRILSPEIEHISTEDTITLKILPPEKSLWVDFLIREFTGYPGDRIKVPALIHNWSTEAKKLSLQIEASLSKEGRNLAADQWFPQGNTQSLYLGARSHEEIDFFLVPPKKSQTISNTYQLTLEGSDDSGNSSSTYAEIEIFPFGTVLFTCPEPVQQAISQSYNLNKASQCHGVFELLFENKSNLKQQITIDTQVKNNTYLDKIEPETLIVETAHIGRMHVSVVSQRPWFIPRKTPIKVNPALSYPLSGEAVENITINPNSQKLELKLKPIFPIWLQVLCFLGALGLTSLLWLYSLPKSRHTAPVSSVSILASGDTVFSGSADQKLIHWQVNRGRQIWLTDARRPQFQRIISKDAEQTTTDKPIGVIRHLPEAKNNQIALGLQDGNIELWDIDNSIRIQKFSTGTEGSDRIFDLAFSKDTRYLFSGHGSGRVNQWRLKNNPAGKATSYLYLGTAISSIAVSTQENTKDLLIAGGRFNRLAIWDYSNQKGYNLAYKQNLNNTATNLVTSPNSYITSIATADLSNDRHSILVTADNQGLVTTWNLDKIRNCTKSIVKGKNLRKTRSQNQEDLTYFSLLSNEAMLHEDRCGMLMTAQWPAAKLGQSIRAIQISNNGCYLATAGNDGRVMLWPLTESSEPVAKGLEIKTFENIQLKSIDLYHEKNGDKDIILISSDAPNNQIQLYRKELTNNGCQ